jgi:hypothetical protein
MELNKETENDLNNDDINDQTYVPKQIIDLPAARGNTKRNRRPPRRYSASEYDMSCIASSELIKDSLIEPKKNSNKRHTIGKMYYLFIMTILFMIMTTSNAQRTLTKTDNLGELFGQAHVCGSTGYHSTYIAVPDLPNCEWEDPRTKVVENVLATPYFQKTFSDNIIAYGCQIERNVITTFMGFFGTKSVLDKSTTFKSFDPKDCLTEILALTSRTSNLEEVAHDTFTNDTQPFTTNYYWCCQPHIIERYRLLKKKLNFNNIYSIKYNNIDN